MGYSNVDVGLESFLRGLLPPHRDSFTSAETVRALEVYTSASQSDISSVVDVTRSHHTFEKVRSYAMKLTNTNRETSEEQSRMTVMLPMNHGFSDGERSTWKNVNCPSPSPSDHCTEQNRKICKQFQASGRCTFGSRCLYHHVRPQQRRGSSPHAFGIVDRCVKKLQTLQPPGETAEINSKGKRREVFAALPSATNNYCLSPKTFSGAVGFGETFLASQRAETTGTSVLYATSPVAMSTATSSDNNNNGGGGGGGGFVMLPLSLPNGTVYGYAPFHLHMPSSQYLSH